MKTLKFWQEKPAWIAALTLLFAIGPQAHGHGEDKPGPNGGFVRMPGIFHTEIIAVDQDTVKVYLLDVAFKSPMTKKSSVKLKLNEKVTAKCKAQKADGFFLCDFPKGTDLNQKGQLQVSATRDGNSGRPVAYELPLKLADPSQSHGSH